MTHSELNIPHTILLDLDGVIANTFWIHEYGWKSILALYGVDNSNTNWDLYRGVPTREAIVQLLEDHEIEYNDEAVEFLVNYKILSRNFLIRQITASHVNLFVGNLLKCLKDLPIEITCVATTTAANDIIGRLGILSYFSEIIGGQRLFVPKKIGADVIVKYAKDKNIPLKKMMFIDDDWRAIDKSRAVGIPSLHISEVKERLKNINCDSFGISSLYTNSLYKTYK